MRATGFFGLLKLITILCVLSGGLTVTNGQGKRKLTNIQLQHSEKILMDAKMAHQRLKYRSQIGRDSIALLLLGLPSLWQEVRRLDSINEELSAVIARDFGENPWDEQVIDEMNTGREAGFLHPEEKQILVALNLARSYPEKYAELYIRTAIGRESWNGRRLSYCGSSNHKILAMLEMFSNFHHSCYFTLKQINRQPCLQPDEGMYELAACHAEESGREGTMGHFRKTCPDGYSGECCHYGKADPFEIIQDLLIDACVPSFGHRKILLDARYSKIGIARRPHASMKWNTVLDVQ